MNFISFHNIRKFKWKFLDALASLHLRNTLTWICLLWNTFRQYSLNALASLDLSTPRWFNSLSFWVLGMIKVTVAIQSTYMPLIVNILVNYKNLKMSRVCTFQNQRYIDKSCYINHEFNDKSVCWKSWQVKHAQSYFLFKVHNKRSYQSCNDKSNPTISLQLCCYI